jgi:hypothetical protein
LITVPGVTLAGLIGAIVHVGAAPIVSGKTLVDPWYISFTSTIAIIKSHQYTKSQAPKKVAVTGSEEKVHSPKLLPPSTFAR